MLIAHSQNSQGEWHELSTHLSCVADLAMNFSQAWGDPLWARLAGAWHDLGKARGAFQRHVQQDANAHIEARVLSTRRTHSAAGALHAESEFSRELGPKAGAELARALQYLIAGHHAGLADWHTTDLDPGLSARLAHPDAHLEYAEALQGLRQAGITPHPGPGRTELVEAARQLLASRQGNPAKLPLARSLRLRMLFSALVDADFLDTETHFDAQKSASRGEFPPLSQYRERLNAHLQALSERVHADSTMQASPVMQARSTVQAACRAKAELPPGVFTLTVPTGGGKTLSSLAFALDHALRHGLHRVIYAIPYTSIIEQTASVFAGIFGDDNVIEHHSQTDAAATDETAASRLAAENWDAPLIVTTNVQLFESLFASRTSRCRKLHRLARSVIVLDEAQLLPPEFLQPILDSMNVLLMEYGISVVLCTATQPVLSDRDSFDPRRGLRGLPPARPIIDQPEHLFDRLRRTEICWPRDMSTPLDLRDLAHQMLDERCSLSIVNTRLDAMTLCRMLPEGALHLSAAMCGAHRAEVVQAMRRRLADSQNAGQRPELQVVSTQLIEAGVDVDFPVVFRALAGLDSIAQAAGRCNREGRLPSGSVNVFVRPIPRPLSLLRSAAETTVSLHSDGLGSQLLPDDFDRHLKLIYARQPSHDAKGVVEDLCDRDLQLQFKFRTAANKFRLVDDADQSSLLIPLHRILEGHLGLEPLIVRLVKGDVDRWLLRAVQRYIVTVRRRQLDELVRNADAKPLACGLFLLDDIGRYDRRFGLLTEANPLDAASLVQ